jgi:hypothetical protein
MYISVQDMIDLTVDSDSLIALKCMWIQCWTSRVLTMTTRSPPTKDLDEERNYTTGSQIQALLHTSHQYSMTSSTPDQKQFPC